jgi:hypothetical protein
MLSHAARVPSVNAEAPSIGEAAVVGSGFPVVVLAAAVLAAEQVSGVLVGSAALRLRGEPVTVGDVDVVIEPEEANLRRLREALYGLTVRPEAVPAVHRLRDVSVATVFSSYGRVDCLLERGRRNWEQLRAGAGYVAVADDLAALAAGQYAELGLHARVTVTDAAHVRDRVTKAAVPGHRPPRFTQDPSRPVIVIDTFPPYANTDEIIRSIADRAQGHAWHARYPELGALTGLQIGDVADLTARGDYWFACLPSDGTLPEVLRDQLLKVHGVSIYITARLPRPLPAMIKTWIRANQDEDLPGSLTALENALASRQQKRLTARY